MNYAVTLAFDGTRYCGWQVQNNAISIQQTVQDAAEKVFGKRPDVTGCSRTDSGVHAREYLCVISDVHPIDTNALPIALNGCLPRDIAVLNAREVSEDFHPRYHCLQRNTNTFCGIHAQKTFLTTEYGIVPALWTTN